MEKTEPESDLNPADFLSRTAAFLIDVVPITLAVALIFYLFLGFDDTLDRYLTDRENLEARAKFLSQRNWIRNLSGILWVIYCVLAENSGFRGTLGKRLLGIQVVGTDGKPLSMNGAIVRNVSKVLSFLPLFLGCLWALFDRKKQAWHDKIAGARLISTKDLDD